MASPGIEFNHVWKKFRRGEHHDSLRDLIPALARRVFSGRHSRVEVEEAKGEFWAVSDVSFSVSPGEALGIIGPNGAGKSTILKLLTRILIPNRGVIHVQGRVGALIEVAAGFHGDLTGRENIFLQGAVMGMPRELIRRHFDAIVEFSGVGDFLDTPVKRFSSGMNARLGFAVAAHLEPEVLIVDEVLAVGDASFQSRAFGRIRELVKSGIPVVVVSHQLDKIAELCTSAILLDRGRVRHQGDPADCIRQYMRPVDDKGGDQTEGGVLRNLVLPDGSRVCSGDRLRLMVDARMLDGRSTEVVEPLAIMVRSAQTGATVAAVGTSTCGISIPGDSVARIEASLQMNVPAGVYTLETLVWDRKASVAIERGPSVAIVVAGGPDFIGDVQLNARMRLAGEGEGAAHPLP